MRSTGRIWSTSNFSDDRSSGSLSALSIEPDTSTRNTRLAGGRLCFATSCPLMATRSSTRCAFHGAGASAVCTANGRPSRGNA